MRWFRMYAEFGSDPKIQILSEAYQRRYVMILCLKCNGDIPGLTDKQVAYALNIRPCVAILTKKRLIEDGFIDEFWNPTAWEKRQYSSDTSAERMKLYRQRLKDQVPDVTTISDSVIDLDNKTTLIYTDTDTEGKPSPLRNSDVTVTEQDGEKARKIKKPSVRKNGPLVLYNVASLRKSAKKCSEYVFLTDAEMEKLIEDFGQEGAQRIIEILDSYKANTPSKCFGKNAYIDDYKVIRNWVIKRYNEEIGPGQRSVGGPPRNRAMDQLKLMVEEEDRKERAAKGSF